LRQVTDAGSGHHGTVRDAGRHVLQLVSITLGLQHLQIKREVVTDHDIGLLHTQFENFINISKGKPLRRIHSFGNAMNVGIVNLRIGFYDIIVFRIFESRVIQQDKTHLNYVGPKLDRFFH